jgi:protease IV
MVLKAQISSIYDEFKDRVSRGRELKLMEVNSIAGGRVWTGAEALEIGLADELGGFREALRKARELGEIKDGAPAAFVKISPPRGGRPTPGDPAEAARETLDAIRYLLSELRASRVWAVAPYQIYED